MRSRTTTHPPRSREVGKAQLGLRALLALAFVSLTLAVVQVSAVSQAPSAEAAPAGTCAPVTLPNGSFETPTKTSTASSELFAEGTTGLEWQTTAADNNVEYWSNGAAATAGNNNVPITAHAGTQWAEINASAASYLYQDVTTVGGQLLRWGIWHRGRSVAGTNGTDSMSVRMGSTTTQSAQTPTGATSATITDGPDAWTFYTGTYTVPAGQTTTRFGFESVSTSSGNAAVGNFIDDISLTSEPCVTTATTVANLDTTRAAGVFGAGDTVRYTATTTNPGGPATATVLTDSLPAGVTYVAGSTRVDGTARTDAAGDDVASFADGTLTVRLGTGASATAGGTFANGATSTVTFDATIDPATTPGTTRTDTASTTFQWAPSTTSLTGTAGSASFTTSDVSQPALSCANIYVVQGAAPRNIWQVDPATGALSATGSAFGSPSTASTTGNFNALGVSDDGRQVYSTVPSAADANVRQVYRYDRPTGSTVLAGSVTVPTTSLTTITHGGVNPRTGIYYFGGLNGTALSIYGFDTVTGQSLGQVATATLAAAPGGNGDLAFDTQGNLYVVAASTTAATVYVVTTPLATTGTNANATLVSKSVITYTGTAAGNTPLANGIAFGAQGDRRLYLTNTSSIRTINPVTGALEATQSFSGAATNGGTDASSCASPNTIEGQVSFPGGRAAAADQATVTITGGGLASGNAGTTTGTDAGLQDTPAETAGPVFGLDAQSYTVTQSGVTGPDYVTTYRCVNRNTGASLASGSGQVATFAMPSDAGADGTSAYCLFTNTRLVPQVSLDKQAGTPSDLTPGSTVPYTFLVTNTGNVALSSVTVTDGKVGTVACPSGALAPGASKTCTATYTLTAADVDAGQVVNTASVTGAPAVAGLTAPDPSATDTNTLSIAGNPSIQLTKTATQTRGADNTLDVGDTIAYSFLVRNTGNVSLGAVGVTDAKAGTVTCPGTALAAGASVTCTAATYTVTQADVDAGNVVNTATATGTPPTGAAVTDDDTVVTPTSSTRSVLLGLTATVNGNGDSVTGVGDTITYSYEVRNTGTVTLTDPTVTDTLGLTVSCPTGPVAPGARVLCTAPAYAIQQRDVDAGAVTNTATVRATPPTGAAVTDDDTAVTATTSTPTLDLTVAGVVTDRDGDGRTGAGDTVAYTYTITNTGPVALTDVGVTDTVDGTPVCGSTTLAINATTTCTVTYTVTQADVDAGGITNNVTASGTPPTGPATTVTATSTTPTSSAPVVTIDLTGTVNGNGDGVTGVGDTITYSYRVTNTGRVTLNTPTVTDTVGSTITCPPGTLAPRASVVCTGSAPYAITQQDVNAGAVTDTATIRTTSVLGVAVTDDDVAVTATSSTPAVAVTIARTVADTVADNVTGAGDTVTYTYTVTNNGLVPLTGVTVTDSIPGTPTCAATTLDVGASTTCTATYVLTQGDVDAGALTNDVTAVGTPPRGSSATVTGTGSDTLPIGSTPSVRVDLTGTVTDVDANSATGVGDTITYSYRVTNTGSVDLSDPTVTDTSGRVVTCAPGTLAPGASLTCTASAPYTITQADVDAGAVTNTVTVSANPPTGAAVTDDDTAVTRTTSTPSLSIAVSTTVQDTDGVATTGVGDVIVYTATITNTGPVSLTGVVLSATNAVVGTPSCTPATVPVGDTTTCVATHTVTQADVDAGAVPNALTATGTPPTGPPASDTKSLSTPTFSTPAITIDLTGTVNGNGDSVTGVGDTVTYTYRVTNTGPVTLARPTVSDTLGLTITCPPGTLAPRASVVCTASAPYPIAQRDVESGAVTDTATVTSAAPDGTAVTDSDTAVTPTTSAPSIMLTVTPTSGDTNNDGRIGVGDVITYDYLVTNNGPVALTTVAVVDSIPGDPVCPVTTLATGASTTCTATYTITQADVDRGSVPDTVTASGTSASRATVQDTKSVSTPTNSTPTLRVDISPVVTDVDGNGANGVGDTVAYTYTITNTGPVALSNVTLTDTVDGTPTCQATSLPVDGSTTCTVTVTITQAMVDAGGLADTVDVAGTSPAGATATATDTSVTVTGSTPSVQVTLTGTATDLDGNGIEVGDPITYTVVVTNNGPVTLTDPQVTMGLGLTVACPPGALAPRATVSCTVSGPYTITQGDVDAGSVDTVATVTASGPGATRATGTDPESTATRTVPAIDVAVTSVVTDVDRDGDTGVGDTITYTYTLTNQGTVALTGVGVTDTVAGTPVCAATTLPVGGSTTCTVTVTISQADVNAGAVSNTVTASGTSPSGVVVSDVAAQATATYSTPSIVLDPVGVVADTNNNAVTDAGDTITYTYTVTNNGPVPLAVSVDDQVPGTPACQVSTLAPGASTTCSATYVITQGDVDNGTIPNAVTATGTPPTGAAVSDTGTVTTPTGSTPAIQVSLAGTVTDLDGNGTDAGDTVTYTVTVRNTGAVTLTDPVVTLGRGLTATCPTGPLAPGAVLTCAVTGTYTLLQSDVDAGTVSTTATVTAAAPGGATATDDDVATTALTPTPALRVTLTAAPVDAAGDGLGAGDTITYTYTVTNTGGVALVAPTVRDSLGNTVTCPTGPLAPGASVTCTSTYTLTTSDEAAGGVSNTASASGTPPTGPATTSSSATVVTATGSTPTVQVVLSGAATSTGGTTDAGDTITYTYTVTNTGRTTLTTVAVADTLGSSITCPAGPLAAGATVVCTAAAPYTITSADAARGSVVNTATVTGSAAGGAPVTDTDTTTTPTGTTPAVTIALTGATTDVNGNGRTDAGDTIFYTYTVTNSGPATLTNLGVTTGLGLTVTCPTASLAPGASATCTVSGPHTITPAEVAAGTVTNTATVVATGPAGASVTDADTVSTPTSVLAPALSIDKRAAAPVDVDNDGVSDAGDTIAYTFLVTNTGGTTLTGVTVDDPMFTSVSCQVGVLAPGASTTCSASHTITAAEQAAGTVDNTATASASTPGLVVLTSAPDTTTTPVVGGRTGISVDKKVSGTVDVDQDDLVDAGDTVSWEFVVTNTGTLSLTGVTVSDPLLAATQVAVTCPSTTLAPGASTTCRSATAYIYPAAEEAGRIVNTATATGTNPSGLPASAQDTATLEVSTSAKGGGATSNNGTTTTNNGVTTGTGNAGTAVDAGTSNRTTLPNTGSEIRPWMPVGGVLLVLGGLFLVLRRRPQED